MRILHISESLNPAHGGTPQVAKALASAQGDLGGEVTILTRDEPEHADAIRESMADMPGAERVTIACVPRGERFDRFLSRPAAAWVRDHAGEFDFGHLHSMWSPIPHGAARGLASLGVPYTLCPHGMLDGWSMGQSRLRKALHLRLLSGQTMRRCAFIHALNDHEKGCVGSFNFGSPVEVLSNGVFRRTLDTPRSPDVFRAERPAIGQNPYVIFLGRLHYKKGLDLLADAFSQVAERVPEAHLVLVGPEGGAGEPTLATLRDRGLADRVHALGPIYGGQKYDALAGAVGFCLPSRQEGFSVAVCEALACGTPAIISEDTHFPELAEAGAGVVCPLDARRFAVALAGIFEDRERGRAMGERGRAMVAERYTWDTIARRSFDLYTRHRRD